MTRSKMPYVALAVALVWFIVIVAVAQTKPSQSPTSLSATIAVPELDQLQWSNLTLQAANLRLQADTYDTKANAKLTEIKARLADGDADAYDFTLRDGKMLLVRRSEKSPEPIATPKPKEKQP